MHCRGPSITQTHVENAIQVLRGGLDPSDWFEWTGWIYINSTMLETLDLTPFFQTSIERIIINFNPNLNSIKGPSPGAANGKIGTRYLQIHNNPKLDDTGLGSTLKYFATPQLEELNLERNNISGYYADGDELLVGLSELNPITIRLRENPIRRIKPGSFKNLTRLASIEFIDNQIEEILENTFQVHENSTAGWYNIFLNGNPLRNERIHQNIGVSNINARIQLYFHDALLETFPRDVWEPLLNGRLQNKIQVYRNPINCDERVKWLKDNRDKYRLWFLGGDCANDPGFTVFTSNLIP
jgi:hypothetical protein